MGSYQSHFKGTATLSSRNLYNIMAECGVGEVGGGLIPSLLSSPAQPWTSQLCDLTGFSFEDLIPCVLSLHKKW